jgi:ribosome recycling factor
MLEDLKKDATQRMQKCVSAFRDQLKKLRTGRAHTSLIEHIKVDYYGTEMPLNRGCAHVDRESLGEGHGAGD